MDYQKYLLLLNAWTAFFSSSEDLLVVTSKNCILTMYFQERFVTFKVNALWLSQSIRSTHLSQGYCGFTQCWWKLPLSEQAGVADDKHSAVALGFYLPSKWLAWSKIALSCNQASAFPFFFFDRPLVQGHAYEEAHIHRHKWRTLCVSKIKDCLAEHLCQQNLDFILITGWFQH